MTIQYMYIVKRRIYRKSLGAVILYYSHMLGDIVNYYHLFQQQLTTDEYIIRFQAEEKNE